MYPTLFVIPDRIADWPLFGFGLLLAVWAVASVALLAWLVRKQGFNADTRSYLPVLALFGITIVFLLPAAATSGGLPIRGYGVMVLIAFSAACGLTLRRFRQMDVDLEILYSMAFWLLVCGIVGARLFYVIEYWDDLRQPTLGATLATLVNLTQGGLVIYGALLGGGLALLWFVRSRQLPGLALCDLIAPAAAIGLGIGRIGCLLTGCCYGGICDLPWAIRFPAGSPAYLRQVDDGQVSLEGLIFDSPGTASPRLRAVAADSPAARQGFTEGDLVTAINRQPVESVRQAQQELWRAQSGEGLVSVLIDRDGRPRQWRATGVPTLSLPVHPTQIYSAIDGVVIGMFLLAWFPFRRRDGEVTALLFTCYGVTRFLVEFARTDEPPVFGTNLTISQNLSIALLAGAVVLWIYLWRQPRGSVLPVWQPADQAKTSSTISPSTKGSGRFIVS